MPARKTSKKFSETVDVPVGYKIVTAEVAFDRKASRLEALPIRPVWLIGYGVVMLIYSVIYGIIVLVYGVVAGALAAVNWLSSLILGRRPHVSFVWAAKFLEMNFRLKTRLLNYSARRMPYFLMMTDKRPALEMEGNPDKEPKGSLA